MQVNNLFEPNDVITLESYLNKMGIDNVQKYLKPPVTVLDNCYIYDNMKECVQTIKYHILNNSKIAIIEDADTDGICSAYIIYKTLKLHGINKVRVFIQNGKERGIESPNMRKQILEWKPNLLIIPDAGTNSADWEDEIIDNGIDICVIDHHDPVIDEEDNSKTKVCKRAIIVNNTMNQFECNTKLSGTGVTFKVAQALDLEMGTKYSNHFIDLVGLSIISDNMDVRTYENRWFIKYLLEDKEHINNPFIYELFNDGYTQKDVSFKIVPLFNSVIRCGTLEDKQKLFMAFCGKDIEETLKICNDCHKEQVEKVDNFVKNHKDKIEEQADSNITIINSQDCVKAFNGLCAGRISGMTNDKPCIVGKTIGNELCGSFRGYINVNTMSKLPHVTMAQGHETGAYGIKIDISKSQNLDDFRAEIDKMDISTIPTVITSYSANKLQMGVFDEFIGHDDLWGKELDKPTFYIYNIRVNNKDIKLMGKNQDTIKITLDKYVVMFFNLKINQIEQFKLGVETELNINVIGTLNINEYYGHKTKQIIVQNFEIEEVTNTFEDLM